MSKQEIQVEIALTKQAMLNGYLTPSERDSLGVKLIELYKSMILKLETELNERD